jgi:hypothetical protein
MDLGDDRRSGFRDDDRNRERARQGLRRQPRAGGDQIRLLRKADEHQLKPEQNRRGPNDEYIVNFQGYTFVIPADKAPPSNDHCSRIFFENVWLILGGNAFPRTPKVYCFLTPLVF